MKEFIPYLCWMDFDYTILSHMQLLRILNIKGIRGFFNTDDVPYSATMPNQAFINKCFDAMPNPMHAWTYENHPLPWLQKGKMSDLFTVCKQEKWLPIISFGCQEETPHGWLGRAIPEDKWNWLVEFVRQLGIYLRDTLKLERVYFEWWNEPTKLEQLGWGYNKYCALGNKIAIAWHSVSPNYKFGAFADDLTKLYYLKYILADKVFCKNIDIIFTHIGVGSEDSEWNENKIAECNRLISIYPHLKQSVSELTCNGIISRLNQLPNQTIGYGHIGLLRHLINGSLLGTRMDDYAIWDSNLFAITAQDKINYSAKFNKDNYKPYILENDGMELNLVKPGSINDETKAVQEILLNAGYVCTVTGKYDENTGKAIKEFQSDYKITVDGKVGRQTWDRLISETSTGLEQYIKLINKGMVFK